LLTPLLFAFLPFLIANPIDRAVNAFHIAILLLITVTDLEHRLIFDRVTLPGTGCGIAGQSHRLSGGKQFAPGPAGRGRRIRHLLGVVQIGAADVWGDKRGAGGGGCETGAAVGGDGRLSSHLFTLFWGVVLGGVVSLLLLLSGRAGRATTMPYGQYLTISGIVMLIVGRAICAAVHQLMVDRKVWIT
jgi:prepilin signal peptidase PulO-like enzyme (type II secretory pathway)